MGETPLAVAPRGRDAVENGPAVAAAFVTVVGFGLLGTPTAAAIALVPAVVLVLGGPLLAFMSGTIALVGVGETVGIPPVPGLLVIASFLLAATYDKHGSRPAGAYLAVVVGAVGSFVIARATLDGLAVTAALLIGGVAFVGYGIHRYELLTLGLLDE